MGTTKPNIFAKENEKFAKISHAIGNHWRIEIINQLIDKGFSTKEELTNHLKLTQNSVYHHLEKLLQANLIRKVQCKNTYQLYLNKKTMNEFNEFIKSKSGFKDDNAA